MALSKAMISLTSENLNLWLHRFCSRLTLSSSSLQGIANLRRLLVESASFNYISP